MIIVVICNDKKRIVFENKSKGITDFIIQLNRELKKNNLNLKIGILKKD